jgi:hypothetical protein
MHKDRSQNHFLDDWTVDANVIPHPVNKDGLDVRGLRIEGLLDGAADEVVARTVHVVSEEAAIENTEERAAKLRVFATDIISRCLSIDGELFDDVELVLAELIQNAQRYSASGPVWVSAVQTVVSRDDQSECVLDLTVANDEETSPVAYQYPDEDVRSENELDDVDVHGQGLVIVEALSLRHGRFVVEKSVGAYALMHCAANHDESTDRREMSNC